MKSRAVLTFVRDILCLALGIGGILHQEITGRVEVPLLVVYASLLGTPGAVHLLQLGRTRGSATTTDESSQPSPSASSSPSSSSSP